MVFKLKQDLLAFKTGTKIVCLNDVGYLGQLPWGWEIPVFILLKNSDWFENLIESMTKEERLELIKKHFANLRECYAWRIKYLGDGQEQKVEDLAFYKEKIEPAVEQEIIELEKLGVQRDFSTTLYVFGANAVREELLKEVGL